MTTTKPETGIFRDAEAEALAAGLSRGAALDAGAARDAFLNAAQVRKLQRVRAVLAELAEAEVCDGETSGALLLARADVGDVLAGCLELADTDDDDDDTAELAAQAYERR